MHPDSHLHTDDLSSGNTTQDHQASTLQTGARLLLGTALVTAGISHLTTKREEFQAQVPESLPLDKDFTVLASGIVEISLGGALILFSKRRVTVGWVAAAFFTAIFPGNIAQYINHKDAFGLNSDRARAVRLAFQPLLILWALWSTGAWPRKQ